ncbi:protein-disulfide reductase DsbD [Massilia dura]|uniref:Thiol:disulfide interchange protein DsbD n=1 Tax=Pseudoduganella dura TaxID=321982 RepID=A0A6I3XMW7_9BURK|nr:protein-disulfide reductase DsbD [Pseudoduganella dura]MUI13085.1 protein-disulfide reductase DsbD [Pseudoduganella dura]GGY09675.1 thiol:disulfide interchange protein DsbD [Pseudoduganella dura]
MPTFPRLFFRFFLLVAFLSALSPARAEDDFLPPDVAFQFYARMADAGTVEATWQIAEGYYMYREQFRFKAAGARLGAPDIPPGKVKFDETFNKNVETYRHRVTMRIPVEAAGAFTLTATGQGCSDKGLCYSPQDATAQLSPTGEVTAARRPAGAFGLPAMSRPGDPVMEVPAAAPAIPATAPALPVQAARPVPAQSELSRIEGALQGGRLAVILPLFLLLGLGLAFTPCVLPMVPILSSIIVGEGEKTGRGRGLVLSLCYALGMAIVYTALGVAAGLAGEGLAAALQNPWVLGAFGVLMALLALSMFGVYELQVPAALQTRLAAASGRRAAGKLAGVFAMGAISALIVGPCVAAPLAGALVYISQTRDVVVGGAALFALAAGMSVPLILVGVSAGALLPRAGAWMEAVKRFFGVLLLAMAWWLVSPVLPGIVQMAGWTLLGIAYGIYLLRHHKGWPAQALAVAFIGLGIVQIIGVATGARDPLAPLAHVTGNGEQALHFTRIKSMADLDRVLADTGGKNVMLDFYADWCVACKEMEKLTFIDPAVQQRLGNTILIQADVTANSDDDKALLKRFNLFGPPGIIFFDRQGREITDSRVIGFQNSEKFLGSLDKLQ